MTTSEPELSDAGGTEALDRSREAIDEAKEAARLAMGDSLPDLEIPGSGRDADTGQGEVTPRPS